MIFGSYKITKGFCPLAESNDPYTGTVEISRTGENYRVIWDIGGKKYYGTGVLCGLSLAVAYDLEKYGFGVGAYVFNEEFSKYSGIFAVKNVDVGGDEYWERI